MSFCVPGFHLGYYITFRLALFPFLFFPNDEYFSFHVASVNSLAGLLWFRGLHRVAVQLRWYFSYLKARLSDSGESVARLIHRAVGWRLQLLTA